MNLSEREIFKHLCSLSCSKARRRVFGVLAGCVELCTVEMIIAESGLREGDVRVYLDDLTYSGLVMRVGGVYEEAEYCLTPRGIMVKEYVDRIMKR